MSESVKAHPNPSKLKSIKPGIGWREWVSLPELGVSRIKCKVDTGARTSSLHAFEVRFSKRGAQEIVHFNVHPLQRNTKKVVACEATLIEWRQVTDSGGKRTLRPVIRTRLQIGEVIKEIEVTLTSRDDMGFRMLLGREAMRGSWVVDPARSYMIGKPKLKHKKKKRSE